MGPVPGRGTRKVSTIVSLKVKIQGQVRAARVGGQALGIWGSRGGDFVQSFTDDTYQAQAPP